MVTSDDMKKGLDSYRALRDVHSDPENSERSLDVIAMLRGHLGMTYGAIARLHKFMEGVDLEDRGAMMAGFLAGALVLHEASPAEVIPFPVPDAPPEDLAA